MIDGHSDPTQIGPEDASLRVEGGSLLLDVREDDEWRAGHAPGARHLPLGRLGEEYASLPRDRLIIAVCRAGTRSEKAAVALRGAGYDIVNLAGGMQAWAAAGQPVISPEGGAGRVI